MPHCVAEERKKEDASRRGLRKRAGRDGLGQAPPATKVLRRCVAARSMLVAFLPHACMRCWGLVRALCKEAGRGVRTGWDASKSNSAACGSSAAPSACPSAPSATVCAEIS